MTIYSGIFNSVNGDRKYNAWWFAKYFATFIGNGVFPNPSTNLQVVSNENMKVVVKPGSGWIDGYFIFSDGDHVLSLDVADGVLKRIDRIVMRLNHLKREIEIVVKKGAFASNPVAPSLQRDTDYYELVLADVFIANGATQITQANITDTRLNNSLCGIVHGTVNQVDTTTLFNQYQSWIEQQKALYTQELELWTADQRLSFEQWMTTQHSDFANWRQLEEQEFMDWMLMQQASFNDWMMQEQTDFEAWVATLEDLLDENIAATLTAKIVTLEQNFDAHINESASTTNKGHVQLEDTITSTSTNKAATANAVKQVNDALTQVNTDLIQVDDTLTTHTDDFTSHVHFAVATNENDKVITLDHILSSLPLGFAVSFANSLANTGPVTLNVNNLGAVPVLNAKGESLKAGALATNSIYTVRYNSTTGNFILQGDGSDSFDYNKILEGLNEVVDMTESFSSVYPLYTIAIGTNIAVTTQGSAITAQAHIYNLDNFSYSLSAVNYPYVSDIYITDNDEDIFLSTRGGISRFTNGGKLNVYTKTLEFSTIKLFSKSNKESTDGEGNIFMSSDQYVYKVRQSDGEIVGKYTAPTNNYISDFVVDQVNQCIYVINNIYTIRKLDFNMNLVYEKTATAWKTVDARNPNNMFLALDENQNFVLAYVAKDTYYLRLTKFNKNDGTIINEKTVNQNDAVVHSSINTASFVSYSGIVIYIDFKKSYTFDINTFDFIGAATKIWSGGTSLTMTKPSRNGKTLGATYQGSAGVLYLEKPKYKVLKRG